MNRFFTNVSTKAEGDVYSVLLDGRALKTPAKVPLHLPTKALAEAIADEWDRQPEKIEPALMPLMQTATTAIDRVATQRERVIEDIVAYGGSDLLCYRAAHPMSLVAKQSAAWDPVLDWIGERHQVTLHVTNNIAHVAQPPEALEKMAAVVATQNNMTLAPLYNITSLCGSLVVALGVLDGRLTAEEAFNISELDETHTMEFWGADAEAVTRRKNNKESLIASTRFLQLCDIIIA